MGRTPMTPEQKAEAAERMRKAREAKKTQEETVADAEDMHESEESAELTALKAQNQMLMEQMKEMREKMEEMANNKSVGQVQHAVDVPQVHFLWNADVSNDTVVLFGDENGSCGRVFGTFGDFYVPKTKISRMMDSAVRYYLEQRWLVVLDGFSKEERVAYGVDYKDGELLDQYAFSKMLEMKHKIVELYPNLCQGHRDMVAARYFEGWRENSPYVSRNIVKELKDLSKSEKEKTLYAAILEEMNQKEAAE